MGYLGWCAGRNPPSIQGGHYTIQREFWRKQATRELDKNGTWHSAETALPMHSY